MKKFFDSKTEKICGLAAKGLLPHAILIETQDINKDAIKSAIHISKTLLCKSSENIPCGKCTSCKKVELNVHPDVQIISAKQGYKSIRTDDVRELRLDAYLAPNESFYKIYIISDGSLMNEQAQNVLLKILEEPPQRVKFIILCKSRFSMLPTIRSRVQIFDICQDIKESTSSKVKSIVESILSAYISGNNFDVMKASSKLVKDKETFIQVLNEIDFILSDLCIAKAGGNLLCRRDIPCTYSLEKLIKTRDNIVKIKDLLGKNVNNQLALCKLYMDLEN